MENIAFQNKSKINEIPGQGSLPFISSQILLSNKPNPIHQETLIQFYIPCCGKVILKIQDALGEEIATLLSQKLLKGEYQIL
jgi:hypothetical protein